MDDVVEPKIALESREAPPICTVLADGSLHVHQDSIPQPQLQRLLLAAAILVNGQIVQRSAKMEQTLASIQAGYSGLREDTEQAIAAALNRPVGR